LERRPACAKSAAIFRARKNRRKHHAAMAKGSSGQALCQLLK